MLTDHLAAFKQHLEAQNDSAKYVKQTESRIKALIAGCGFTLLRDVNLSDVEDWLAKQRTAKIFGNKTSNYYGRDFKSFLAWLVDANRAELNPAERFSPLNADTDDSRQRRALSSGDFTKLTDATLAGVAYRGLSGTDRAMLYLVAAYTGFRASELASLTAESFNLEAAKVTVQAAYSKRRRQDEQPIPAELVAVLGRWLPSPSGNLWPGTWWRVAATMLRSDLAAAALPYTDAAGRVSDFHAIRHHFISGLVSAGVPPKVAQELARYSSIVLTMDRYSHLGEHETAAAR